MPTSENGTFTTMESMKKHTSDSDCWSKRTAESCDIAIHSGRYTGLGTNLISASFAGETIYGYDWILKLLFTIFTLAIGFQGGEVTPLFSIGASLGIILGSLLGIPPVICAALGYAAVFGSATNTLFAPILIGLEVFGSQNIIPLVLVCIIAYLVNGCLLYTSPSPRD